MRENILAEASFGGFFEHWRILEENRRIVLTKSLTRHSGRRPLRLATILPPKVGYWEAPETARQYRRNSQQ